MDEPLKTWYCDVCDGRIDDVAKAYVIWRTTEQMEGYDFKIIHKSKCDRKDHPASAALDDFLDTKGAAYLLSFLSLGPVKGLIGQQPHCSVKNTDEFVDFFRRVQTPYYEEARRLFRDSRYLEENYDNNEVGPYRPAVLKRTIERYGRER